MTDLAAAVLVWAFVCAVVILLALLVLYIAKAVIG